jgi:hypothetical protein
MATTDLEKATNQVDQAGGVMQAVEIAETTIAEAANVEARDGAESLAFGSVEGQTGETETSETEPGEMDESVSTPEASTDGTAIATKPTVSEITSDGNSSDGNLVDVAEIFPDETTDETVIIELTDDGEEAIVPPQQEAEIASSESIETTATTDGSVGEIADQGPENTASSTS